MNNRCAQCGARQHYSAMTQQMECPSCSVGTADTTQAGGSHYKDMAVQPWHLMEAMLTPEEFVGYLKGNLIKYAMRQGRKDSPDAEKYHHYKQKLDEVLGKDKP
jgi:hypothetical protein